jgi:DNA invertase Pin-like site-specific DNA recombinase
VAGYARVSTDSDEQFTSFEAQVDYYTRKIQENPEWKFVRVYTDEGISATNTRKRDGFNTMIADALAGEIDLIVTKSVSRFARNTVDTLTTVRKLKDQGIEVFFEKENIYTLDAKGELLITIMSSLAQEESRSISENVAWGKRAKAASGRVYLPYKQFLGYERGPDGLPQIVESEAKTVRFIYKLFLEGKTPSGIARHLEQRQILSPGGKERWHHGTVASILTNEKYKGDAILQKTFCTNFLTKKMKRNEGELPQYYVTGSHPAIIPPEVFDEVQMEMKRRRESKYTARDHCFSGRIICGDCGALYIEKVWHSTSQYKRRIWQCSRKFKNDERCGTRHLYEDEVKTAFVQAMNGMIEDKDEVILEYKQIIRILTDLSALDLEAKQQTEEADVVAELIRKCVAENAASKQDQDVYLERYKGLKVRYEAATQRLKQIEDQRTERKNRRQKMLEFIQMLEHTDGLLTDFDEGLWNATVETVTVQIDGGLGFRWRNGMETKINFNCEY